MEASDAAVEDFYLEDDDTPELTGGVHVETNRHDITVTRDPRGADRDSATTSGGTNTVDDEVSVIHIKTFTMEDIDGWTLPEFIQKTLPTNPNTYKMSARLKKAANIPLPTNVKIDIEPVGGIYDGQHQQDLFWQQKMLVKILGPVLAAIAQSPEGAREFIMCGDSENLSPSGKQAEILFGVLGTIYHNLSLVSEKRSVSSVSYLTNTNYKIPKINPKDRVEVKPLEVAKQVIKTKELISKNRRINYKPDNNSKISRGGSFRGQPCFLTSIYMPGLGNRQNNGATLKRQKQYWHGSSSDFLGPLILLLHLVKITPLQSSLFSSVFPKKMVVGDQSSTLYPPIITSSKYTSKWIPSGT
eukprot:TRINITY_DN4476_c0_g4_i5.p1 TRINITY_DN4476_c0_g4~~TRINITY_DN4476_c0_g4_i5.p1  ORF type:complete len:357 (+),score=52.25 TRINITY_DN4476_c0_g4_i5:314-1384(+)